MALAAWRRVGIEPTHVSRPDVWVVQVTLSVVAVAAWIWFGGLTHPGVIAASAGALAISALWGQLRWDGLEWQLSDLRKEHDDMEAVVDAAAGTDPVTGLSNRQALQSRLDAALEDRRVETGLLVVGLDSFGNFNDVLGPHVGDQILEQAGVRLLERLRPTDFLARLGGAEFAVVVPEPTADGVRVLARRLLEALAIPFELEGSSLQLRARVGIAWSQGRRETDVMLREAEVAMHSIRDTAATRVASYEKAAMSGHQRRVELRLGLHEALASGEIETVYQPWVQLADGRVLGMHGLPVWTRRSGDVVWGEELNDLATDAGIAGVLAGHVIDATAAEIQRWSDQGYDLDLGIDLAAPVLEEPELRSRLRAALELVAAQCRLLVFVRHVEQLADPEAAAELLGSLRDEGCRIAVSCAGVPDMLELATLPLDVMTVPGALVHELGGGSGLDAVATRTLQLGHDLKLELMATGVERSSELHGLQAAGCELGRGQLFSRPRSAYAFESLLRRRNSDSVAPGGPPGP